MSTWLKAAIGVTVVWLIIAVALVLRAPDETGPIAFALIWDRNGVDMADDGTWSVTNNLGYTVTVTAGQVYLTEAAAFPCPHEHGVADSIRGFLGVGHSQDDQTDAVVATPRLESFVDPGITSLGPVDGPDPQYCEVHVIYGQELEGNTLELDVLVDRPDGTSERLQLVAQSNVTNKGPLLEVDGLPVPPQALRIQVTRHLETLFQDMDFTGTPAEMGQAVLINMVTNATNKTSG